MQRRWLRLSGLGLGVFVVTLAVQFPAGLALAWSRDRLPVELHWQHADGSIFKASIQGLTVTLPQERHVRFDSFQWRASWPALLLGRLDLRFTARGYDGEIRGRAQLGLFSWRLPAAEGGLSVAALTQLLPELEAAGLDGRLLFRARDLSGSYSAWPGSGAVNATVADLRVALIDALTPLGDYAVHLKADDSGGIRGGIETVSDDFLLGIEGDVSLDPGKRRLLLDGRGWTTAHASVPVRRMLPLLGPVNDGQARIDWEINL